MMKSSFIPVSKLVSDPYSKILGFPVASKRQLNSRLAELKKLGIQSVSFKGESKLGNIDILGKGYVGIVILAKKKRTVVALKIRRTDSQRDDLIKESELLQKANQVDVGPTMITASKNFLIMEYLDGQKIGTWIKTVKGKGSSSKIKSVIKKILVDCYNLDKYGLDHGELSTLTKHVIVGKKKTTIIDFESASTKRRTSNVTAATQGLLVGSGLSKTIQRICKVPEKEKIIQVLRDYKQQPTSQSFKKLLQILRL